MIYLKYLLSLLLLVAASGYAQEGVLKGTLLDDEGLPLPGANVQVKGTPRGVQTDFDGVYAIPCEVGDTLVISYVGYATREVLVTPAMFNTGDVELNQLRKAVQPIRSSAYEQAIRQNNPSFYGIPDLNSSPLTYTVNRKYLDVNRIKSINIGDSVVKLITFADDAFFEIGVSQRSGLQYVPDRNLPQTQNRYAQGRPVDGSLTYRGPETGELFSYGPLLSTLEYDGSTYLYDGNGRPVAAGEGSGMPVRPYSNSIFNTGFNTATSVQLGIYYDIHKLHIDFANGRQRDLFDQDKQIYNRFNLGYQRINSLFNYSLQAAYSNSRTGNANLNALHNQIYYSNLITPPTFSNTQGIRFDNSMQRSFSPGNYNNPYWLLQTNQNQITQDALSLQGTGSYSGEKFKLTFKGHYDRASETQEVNLPPGTAGFATGLRTEKDFKSQNLNTEAKAAWTDLYITDFLNFSPSSTLQYANSALDFEFLKTGSISNKRNEEPSKSTVQMLNSLRADADFYNFNMSLNLQQKFFTSSLQGSAWWLPDLILKANLGRLFYSDFLRQLHFTAAYSNNVGDLSLYYSNYGYNSLNLGVAESQQYTTNADLFNNLALKLETITGFDFSLEASLWSQVEVNLSYYRTKTDNAIFPVYENNSWQLDNVASLRDAGFEASIEVDTYHYSDQKEFRYTTALSFSTHNPLVLGLGRSNSGRIPIAGFEEISQNLIPGKPVGVLYGSAYLRDEQGNRLIAADGFPIMDSEPQILGDPIPDFNLGLSNTLRYKQFLLKFKLDWQQGGEVWNGTQQVLNYLGTSEESARDRNISNYIFDGLAPDGTPNRQAVAFAPTDAPVTSNRWVRYGYAGIAEAAIADGSFLNLQSLSFTYELKQETSNLFKELSLSLYGNNLWNSAGFKGANPYSNLFGTSAGNALNYFNMPLASEVGVHLNFKI